MSTKIITASREFGSGGRTIAKQIVERFGYAYYDNELVTKIAKEMLQFFLSHIKMSLTGNVRLIFIHIQWENINGEHISLCQRSIPLYLYCKAVHEDYFNFRITQIHYSKTTVVKEAMILSKNEGYDLNRHTLTVDYH